MPTINLLNQELRPQLANLHATRTISKVIARCGSRVDRLPAVFTDVSQPNQRGSWSNERIFELSNGEYISDVIVWNDANSVCAIQFVITQGKFSLHYGGNEGMPIILSSEGGVLAELVEITRDNEINAINHIQTIWRYDIPQTPGIPGERYMEYIGGSGGQPFND
ncbi:hypothetical protein FRC06_010928 [Ceratobasidium sp. 370]|nr:hypothetical protein FRC06_010928 [Ceratobasidium sp. 370]